MGITTKKLAIDLGTATTRIYIPKKGVVVNEPTMIAYEDSQPEGKIIALGRSAREMYGKSHENVDVISPLQFGVIANFRASTHTLAHFIQQAAGRFHIKKPFAIITVSSTATSTEKKALIDAGLEAGLQNVYLIQSAVASALGAGLIITEPQGSMVIDIGSGTTEIGVFSLGGIVAEGAVRIGGDAIDDAIRLLARRELGVYLSADEIFNLKTEFLDLNSKDNNAITITGQSIVQGLPKKVTIKQRQLQSYIEQPLDKITQAIKRTLEKTPPDIVGDIVKHGVILCGGSSQLKGLSKYFTRQLHVACIVTDNPELASIKGAYTALTHLEEYQRSLLA